MAEFPEPIHRLIESLRKLPGVGTKTAQRLALHLMKAPAAESEALARAIVEAKQRMGLCSICFNITEANPCRYCSASDRDDALPPGVAAASRCSPHDRPDPGFPDTCPDRANSPTRQAAWSSVGCRPAFWSPGVARTISSSRPSSALAP